MGCTDGPTDPPAHLWQKKWHWCQGRYNVAVEGCTEDCTFCRVNAQADLM